MQFKYTVTAELSGLERMMLSLRKEPYCFARELPGAVKINPALPAEVVEIAKEMWSIDHLLDEADNDQIDRLCERLRLICGEAGASQLHREWWKDLRDKLDADDQAEARAWLERVDVPDELDTISDRYGAYNPGLLAALWRATENVGAIFLYGYQMGAKVCGGGAA